MKNTLVLSLFVASASFAGCTKDTPPPVVVAPAAPAAAPAAPAALAAPAAAPTTPGAAVPAAMVGAPTAAAPTPAAGEEKKLAALTPAEVEKRRKEANFFVFDNNTKDRFMKGHVPGAKWVDPSALTAADLPADKTATLVFYCANTECSACHVGAQAALKMGYTKVYIMPEGIMGWETAKLPTEMSKA